MPSRSIVIDLLLKEEESLGKVHSSTKTVYFFCDFRDEGKVTAVGMYGSIVSQLLRAYWENDLPQEFAEYFDRHGSQEPREGPLKEQLIELIRKAGRTRIVVDALDEATASLRVDILRSLLELQQAGKVNLLITSREEVDLKSVLSDAPKLLISAAVNSQDIQLYVTEECERNIKLKRKLKGSTKTEVISTISKQAQGM